MLWAKQSVVTQGAMSVKYAWPNKHYIQYIGMEYSPSLGPEPYSTSRLSCSPWLMLHGCFTFRSPFCASQIHPPPFHKFIALHPRHLCARSRAPRNDSVKFPSSTSPRGSVASRTSFAFLFSSSPLLVRLIESLPWTRMYLSPLARPRQREANIAQLSRSLFVCVSSPQASYTRFGFPSRVLGLSG